MLFDSPQTTGSLQISGSLDLGPNAVINDFSLPVGTSSERPTNPSTGDIRFNTTFNQLEVYNGTIWGSVSFNNQIPVQSAQVTATANDAVLSPLEVEYLVIAGGGGGGAGIGLRGGGGGGAGGYRSSVSGEFSGGGSSAESVFEPTLNTSYTVTVGAGGGGGVWSSSAPTSGSNSVFSTITSDGGGNGGDRGGGTSAGNGGSGGGGGNSIPDDPIGPGGSGTANQGFDGGDATDSGEGGGAGGGGSSSAGLDNPGDNEVAGGNGTSSSITGSSVTRASGGRGGHRSNASSPASGGANSGSGGDGGGGISSPGEAGANGGSGVVILRYPSSFSITVGGGLTSSTTTVGANKVTTFTAGTDTISFS